jgi:hypothetical protein
MNLQLQVYAHVTYWLEIEQLLVETRIRDIYTNKNQQIVGLMAISTQLIE